MSGVLDSARHLPAGIIAPAALGFLGIGALYAYCRIFSQFAFYDDEGYLMSCVQRYLEGKPLYSCVLSHYGPFYYFYQLLVHSIISAPVCHDVTGILCLFHWLAAAAVLGMAGYLMTGSPLLGFFVFVQAVVHLTDLIREPGHPQELVVLLLALAALITARNLRAGWHLALLGGVGSALVFTKINVGAFYVWALLLTLLCHASRLQSHRSWFWGLLAISALFPWLLTQRHLAENWALLYSWQACATIVTVGGVAFVFATGPCIGPAQWGRIVIAHAGLSLLLIGVLLLTGTSASALIENLVIGAAKLADDYCAPLRISYSSLSAVTALLGAAIMIGWGSGSDRLRLLATVLKGLFGVLGSVILVADPKAQFGYLLPWLWLMLVPAGKNQGMDPHDGLSRTTLCLVAAWQSLQVYPVAGTQVCIATFLPVLAYAICLHDAVKALPPTDRILHALAPRTVLVLKMVALVGLLYLFLTQWCNPVKCWRAYAFQVPLDLPGDHLHRLSAHQAYTYRLLTSYLQSHCDVFLTYPGLNSLYFWTGKLPPACISLNGEGVLPSERQQIQILAALQQARRPLIVINEQRLPGAKDSESLARTPLGYFLREKCQEVTRLGEFCILAPRAVGVTTSPPDHSLSGPTLDMWDASRHLIADHLHRNVKSGEAR